MAKVSAVEKNKKRIKLAKKYDAKRKKLKKLGNSSLKTMI